MGIRVRLVEDENGEKRVPPEVMELLIGFAHHREFCDKCLTAFNRSRPATNYCQIGYEILKKLSEQPEVDGWDEMGGKPGT